tara:strand:- start:130 stop:234 length:105 start_codon:yes stop_codon:yes gene_type:complete
MFFMASLMKLGAEELIFEEESFGLKSTAINLINP